MTVIEAAQCDAAVASCRCSLRKTACDGVHVCECLGSWSGQEGTPSFRVHRLPQVPLDTGDAR